jgi:glucosyl-dolichyl phosphate glucuronosyltransferase
VITGTIAVCTRDRAGVLGQCLASLAAQLAEPGQLEVLVVDNGSTDGTASLLRSWREAAGDGPARHSVVEPRVGLSHARNRALATSDREVVLFLDDDALVPPTWGGAHLRAHAADDRVGSVGGPIGLSWPAGRPDWITDEVTIWYSRLDLGDEAGPFPTAHGPYGTNMSVRRRAALDVGGYDPGLGRSGRRLLSGEEPDLTRRLAATGWSIRYEPTAAVVQQVLPERLDRRWLVRRGWAQGISNARLAVRAGDRPGRRARAQQAVAEARESSDALARRRAGTTDEVAGLVLAAVHAATALDLARSVLAPDGQRR